MVKVCAIIPTGDHAPTIFWTCFLALKEYLDARKDVEFYYNILTTKPLHHARNKGVDMAMTLDPDYILFLDSDSIFDKFLFNKLYKHKKDIVSALYFAKQYPYRPVARTKDKDGKYQFLIDFPEDEAIKVAGVGMGACLINTKVIKAMKPPLFYFDAGYGEDIYFCKQAEELGFEVWLDCGLKIRHYGGIGIGYESFLHVKKKLTENPPKGMTSDEIKQKLTTVVEFQKDSLLPDSAMKDDFIPSSVIVDFDYFRKAFDSRIVKELMEFTKLSEEEVLTRMATGTKRIREEFLRHHPKTDEEVEKFYRESEEYIWDLSGWHAGSNKMRENRTIVGQTRQKYPNAKTVLDYGCGIGENGLLLAKNGYDVTLVDFDTNTLKFARERAKNYADNVKVITFDELRTNRKDYDGKFDIIFCFDVLEHLTPKQLEYVLAELNALKSRTGELLFTQAFNWGTGEGGSHPMHFDIDDERKRIIKEAFGWDLQEKKEG